MASENLKHLFFLVLHVHIRGLRTFEKDGKQLRWIGFLKRFDFNIKKKRRKEHNKSETVSKIEKQKDITTH